MLKDASSNSERVILSPSKIFLIINNCEKEISGLDSM